MHLFQIGENLLVETGSFLSFTCQVSQYFENQAWHTPGPRYGLKLVYIQILIGLFLSGFHVLSHVTFKHRILKQVLPNLKLIRVLPPKLWLQFLKL